MSSQKKKFALKRRRRLFAEPLEARRVLAASLGWDGPGPGSAELTFTISAAPDSLPQAEVDAAIETALNAWAAVADISFTKVEQTGLRDSIDISFVNLDGAGGTLAQAYLPDDVNPARIAGDIQFDLAESWEIGNDLGSAAFDLTWVAAHEIGHALGLNHAEVGGSVLNGFVSPNQQFVALDSDDVASILELYAPASDAGDDMTGDDTPSDRIDDGGMIDNDGEQEEEQEEGEQHRHRHQKQHRSGGRLLGNNADQLLSRFDADQDGSLTEDEVSTGIWRKLSAADSDEDGAVSLDELETWATERNAEDAMPGNSPIDHRCADQVFAEVGRRLRLRRR